MKRRATLAVGALVACGYLSVAVVTSHVSGHRVLPLYEGVPAPAYQWVNPPAAFKTANVVPKPLSTTVNLGAGGNREGGIASADTQFIATLSAGAIPPKAGATSAAVRTVPLDAGTLGPLPAGVRANGNAYQLSVAYQPSGGTLTSFAAKASVVLSVPLPANRGLFYSSDGHSWTRIAPPAPASETTTIGGSSRNTGYFLAGTTHQATASGSGSGSSGTSLVTVIIGVLVGVVLVGGAVWFLLRLMRPASSSRAKPKPSAGKRPPPRKR